MKYTAKRIIERALSLADLTNTDFLSHQEFTDYLNDSWKSLYQIFINNVNYLLIFLIYIKNPKNKWDFIWFFVFLLKKEEKH